MSGEWVRFLAKLGLVERSRAYYKKRARARAKLRKAGKTVLPTRTRTPSELSFHSFRHSAVSLLKRLYFRASISRIYTRRPGVTLCEAWAP